MGAQQELERFAQDRHFLDEHREELLRRFPERWVAIYNRELVGAAKDPRRLIKQLERKGISPGHVYREYLTDQEDSLIL